MKFILNFARMQLLVQILEETLILILHQFWYKHAHSQTNFRTLIEDTCNTSCPATMALATFKLLVMYRSICNLNTLLEVFFIGYKLISALSPNLIKPVYCLNLNYLSLGEMYDPG